MLVDPLLAGRIVRRLGVASNGRRTAGIRPEDLRRLKLALAGARSDRDLSGRMNGLTEGIAANMDVDPNFLIERDDGLIAQARKAFFGGSIAPHHENNLMLAMTIPPFRSLLGIHVLDWLSQEG
jgi:hypothetical protein